MGTLFCPPHGDVSVSSFCPHLPGCVSTGWLGVEARRGKTEPRWERSGAAGPRVRTLTKQGLHTPAFGVLSRGPTFPFCYPNANVLGQVKEQPCDAECKSKGRQYTANFLGAGAREPLTAGFPDGRAAGWLSIFLGGSSVSERPGPLAALHQRSSWSLAAFRASATGSCPLCGRAQLQDGASCWSRRCPSFASPVLGK